MKSILFLIFILSYNAMFAQLNDTNSSNNGSMTLGNGTGTFYQFAGAQRGDNSNQSQGGFGILSGINQISPIIWMYGSTGKNAFQVRKKEYNATVQNGSTLFHVDVNGNIGIGTTNPKTKLQVMDGGIAIGTTVTGNFTSGNILAIGDSDTGFKQQGDGKLAIFTNDTERMRFNSDGNIGIGVINPAERLHISGNLKFNSEYNKILWPANNTHPYGGGITGDDGTFKRLTLFHGHSIDLQTGSNSFDSSKSRLHINSSGNVGIGTRRPDSKLTVKGNIHSKEIRVTVGAGADFVFEENYKLTELKALEQYIIKNKHLPEIASAKDMESNGIYLAEMNIKLLQKIEELTLYTISQEKQLEKQRKTSNTLQNIVQDLQNRIKKLEEK